MNSTYVLGCRVDDLTMEEASVRLVSAVANVRDSGTSPVFVITLGTEMVIRARRDPKFAQVLAASTFSLCDTIGVFLAAKISGTPIRTRVTGVELVEKICAKLAARGGSIFLFGARDDTAEIAGARLANLYPGLRIAGTRNGYFSDVEASQIAASVRATGADIIFVGLGSPRQEYWLKEYLDLTGCAVGVGVGGTFDVVSGRTARAPRFLQAIGLEWLYRLTSEPHRWRRQLALPFFAYLAIRESLRTRLPRRTARR